MKQRPDSPAVLGLIGLAALLVAGWVILTALGKDVPPELWIALSTVVGVVGGWIGKTLTSEPATADLAPPTVDDFTPPEVVEVPVVGAGPGVNDRAERERISDFLKSK